MQAIHEDDNTCWKTLFQFKDRESKRRKRNTFLLLHTSTSFMTKRTLCTQVGKKHTTHTLFQWLVLVHIYETFLFFTFFFTNQIWVLGISTTQTRNTPPKFNKTKYPEKNDQNNHEIILIKQNTQKKMFKTIMKSSVFFFSPFIWTHHISL